MVKDMRGASNLKCGCQVVLIWEVEAEEMYIADFQINFCSLHAEAENLLAVCKAASDRFTIGWSDWDQEDTEVAKQLKGVIERCSTQTKEYFDE